jgi:GT2 family glycosyltransferase
LAGCLDSLAPQTAAQNIVIVDNASSDGSVALIESKYPKITLLKNPKNLGFAGGVNTGIRYAIKNGAEFVALLNNDAVADKDWLKELALYLSSNPKCGIVTGKIIDSQSGQLDSTGEQYSIWGLPFPRGRGEPAGDQYDKQNVVFGASGGASLYRIQMLKDIGLFDEDFFAYYEDVDLSFRAQLAGWQVAYVPEAIVHHQIGATSGKIKGFYTYQTLKNLPLLLWKNVPWALMPKVYPRFVLAYLSFVGAAFSRGQIWPVLKALGVGGMLWPKKMTERYKIQKRRQVSPAYLGSIIVHDLPPKASRLRAVRSNWWRLSGRGRR